MSRTPTPPVALAIGGSDSGAGAGIQADLKAMSALGVFAATAVTAVTAQNSTAVVDVHPVPVRVVDAQITAVLADLPVASVKTGMLGSSETIALVAERAAAGDLPLLVVDPVMVASTGRPLLDADGLALYRDLLLPHTLVLTPNLWEAAMLAGVEPPSVCDLEGMVSLARRIHELGPGWVLVKGGHLPGVHDPKGGGGPGLVADVLFDGREVTVLEEPRVTTRNNHGTGCTLSAAIAARLAAGSEVPDAVDAAKRFVHRALEGAAGWDLGRGHGPLDPFGWASPH